MIVPLEYVYLVATIPLIVVWLCFYLKRKDLREEMLAMSILLGFLSVVTSYYWWTNDWWSPQTITGTKVGIEDFLMGFAMGGIIAVVYEVVFKKKFYKRKLHHYIEGGFTLLLLLANIMSCFFYVQGFTTFWSSLFAMIIVSAIMFSLRRDLFLNGLLTAVLTVCVSFIFYYSILVIAPEWIDHTYHTTLSGIRPFGIPVEEFIFWFFAGLLFGPFYEYWQGIKLKRKR